MRTISLSKTRWSTHACAGALMLLLLSPDTARSAEATQAETFKLREVSVFDVHESRFLRGQVAQCTEERTRDVKAYPEFRSAKPIFGEVYFGGQYGASGTGTRYCFAADESLGTGKGYDRLYFDLNRNLDLKDDPVLKPQARPPSEARWHDTDLREQVIFDLITVPFDFGSGVSRPVRLMPRLTVAVYPPESKEYKQMTFVRTDIHMGEIKLGGQRYNAILGNDYVILGRLDAPGSALILTPTSGNRNEISWWGGDRLMARHKVGSRFFVCSASPAGDELRVRPDTSELGIFQAGAGTRQLDPVKQARRSSVTVQGSLQSQDAAVAVGTLDSSNGSPGPVTSCSVPVGDYLPSYLNVALGRLAIAVSQNYHSDGKPRERNGRPLVYGITVRKDAPFTLDFSTKPDVLFAAPAKDVRVKRGEQLDVKAVLVDPKLDIMIRRLDDTTRKQEKDSEGRPMQYVRNLSLDPTVIVTRTNGEKVAEGTMPFG